jgi:hypothetical protein
VDHGINSSIILDQRMDMGITLSFNLLYPLPSLPFRHLSNACLCSNAPREPPVPMLMLMRF